MSLSAQAQTASSVTPESFQPPLRNLSGAVVLTGQTGTQAPPGSDQIGITLSGVRVAGQTVVADFDVDGAIVTDAALQQNGTCA